MEGSFPSVVMPGDRLGSSYDLESGPGTYVVGSDICSSLAGRPVVLPALPGSQPRPGPPGIDTESVSNSTSAHQGSRKGMIAVQRPTPIGAGTSILPDVHDEVMGRVARVEERQCRVEILVVRGLAVREPLQAILRKENVRSTDVDRVELEKCFRPGDVIRAEVASMGDARTY